MVAIIKTEWYFLSGPLEMRIGNKIYELEQLGHLEKVTPSGSLASIGSYYINEPMEDRIMLADSIVIRVPYSNQVSTVLAIPPSVLKEWQEVLKVGPQRK